jgi:hypothetical protein
MAIETAGAVSKGDGGREGIGVLGIDGGLGTINGDLTAVLPPERLREGF